ncbi:triose-phosphate isomerase [Candidatus Saccharibacteria bacterium]|nr:triose-phosphate isomerase [Candidatus Saccharibacteria bacterium]
MLLVANWKMNFTVTEAVRNFKKFSKLESKNTEVIIAAPQVSLATLGELAKTTENCPLKIAAQNFDFHPNGARTGETGIAQIIDLAPYALVGHSERRMYYHEHDKDCAQKVAAALSVKIRPILCVGETALERERGHAELVVRTQVAAGLAGVPSNRLGEVIIAYEPSWALSTATNAKLCDPREAKRMLGIVRDEIKALFGAVGARKVAVLYGGSVDSDNVTSYARTSEAEGFLVGGASLNVYSFRDILDKMELLK